MKTVIITGSARGFGYSMLELFRKNNFNCVITDVNEEVLKESYLKLNDVDGKGKVLSVKCDITNEKDIDNLLNKTIEEFKTIDIFINNAGVNQDDKEIWNLDDNTIKQIININLLGTIMCSKKVINIMNKQGFGQIYAVEGFGSNNAVRTGLSIYGTSKRASSYFLDALANETEDRSMNVLVGKITPGIMITNFITRSLGDGNKIEIPEKTKKVYNILGDYPETIAEYMVPKIIDNKKNKANFVWLSNKRAFVRFLTAGFNKRDFFKE